VKSKTDVADELAQLIYLKIVSYSSKNFLRLELDQLFTLQSSIIIAALGKPDEIFNVSESFLNKKDANGKYLISRQTRKQLARIYPKGMPY